MSNTNEIEMQEWLRKEQHLPKFLRYDYSQNLLFRFLGRIKSDSNWDKEWDINWQQGAVYVLDLFLWVMAKRGYTLQRTRKNLKFRDIEEDLEEFEKQEQDDRTKALRAYMNLPPKVPRKEN